MQFSFFQNADDETANRLEGFRYQPALIEKDAEESLIKRLRELPFQEFDFHGYKGKRRVVSFGWKYEFSGGGQLHKADEIPQFLLDLRSRAASVISQQLSSQTKAREIAAAFTKNKHAVKEKFGVRMEKYKDVRSEPAVKSNVSEYSGVYEVPDLG